ncbi:anthranilate synthase component I [Dissulfurispira thermophila]|uniref:Anthranilate synthase component 1 n=2 Tax=root TaxID=1 RepID=A0A7G1GY03_9BACT|nr:anthranilate synthase component I [Dissulfurispira thermophila]BCB95275.1 anthranilate synthase component I [Dissulfurispira thermophila]
MNLNPQFDKFEELSRYGNLIPVYKEIFADVETPVSAFLKLNKKPSFLLESVVGGEKWARYSFIGIMPSITVTYKEKTTEIIEQRSGNKKVIEGNPLDVIKNIISRFKPVDIKALPRFSGGFVGYIGYDVVKLFERVPDISKPEIDMPDIFLMLTDTILIFDNLRQTIKIVHNIYTEGRDLKDAYKEAEDRIDEIISDLRTEKKTLPMLFKPVENKDINSSGFSSNFTKEGFLNAVEKAKEYIMSGDIVQVVLSQRFEKQSNASPFDIYRTLRIINPSPYMYYLDTGDSQIVGSSPEILVRLEGDKITLRPIAGTRKRGETEEEDKALESDLKKDPKEIAEHIMLVDLGRNDVGRVAEIGSVKVTELMTIERYSHVMHMVSNVEGRLKKGLDAFDVFKACFPAGTVSGAPKVRAMEIIEELEPTKRGPYAGAIGYFSYSKNMDTCITIRTLIIKDGRVYVQAGAGIVADSIPENEYTETVNKAMAMMKAVEAICF